MASTQTDITITLLKYNDWYTTRTKDVKRHHWFSFPNDLLTHPDFFGITGDEFKAFAWCVSVCSKVMQPEIRLNIPHSCSILSISEDVFKSMFLKLQGKQIDVVSSHGKATQSHELASTLHNITEHNTTLHNRTSQADEVSLFFDFWNSQEKLPKALKLTSARRVKIKLRLKESGLENLKATILIITETPFLLGENDRSWKADIDWLIANEQNGLKVNERKYKTNTAKSLSATKAAQIFDTARDQIEKIKRGEI